jgi:phage shock protein PspC (stress-responsive transcriptional regulator)
MKNRLIIDKKGWTARDFVVATLIFSGGIALFMLMVGSLANDYNNENVVDPEFSNKFDKFSEDTDRAVEMWNATTSEGGLSLIGTSELLFFSTFKVISLIFNGVVASGQQLTGFGEFFGIPSEVTGIFLVLIFSILTVIIVFLILSSIRSGRDL